MKQEKKSVTVKGYANRKHKFEIDKTTISGHTFYTLRKNGNSILRCDPKEFVKFKILVEDM